jgi:hypothetical protein
VEGFEYLVLTEDRPVKGDRLNTLGAVGWELVSVLPYARTSREALTSGGTESVWYYFIRPRMSECDDPGID